MNIGSHVHITPRNKKAKNKFINRMRSNPNGVIEQIKENRIFVVAEGQKECFWLGINGNQTPEDDQWQIELI